MVSTFWNFITENENKNLDWRCISKHKYITWEIIKNNPTKVFLVVGLYCTKY